MKRPSVSMASRAMAAILGGYVLTSAASLALTLLLQISGVQRAEALLVATMLSFLIYVGVIMAVFHANTASRAWMWLIFTGTPLSLLAWCCVMRGEP